MSTLAFPLNLTLSDPCACAVPELQRLNEALLSGFIDVLKISKQPESYLFDLKKKRESKAAARNTGAKAQREPKPLIRHTDVLSANELAQSQMPMVLEPSQLTPLINDKCESLKLTFRAMRDILNSMRPHQARQTLIQTLHKQLVFKRDKLKAINAQIAEGQRLCRKRLNESKANDGGEEEEEKRSKGDAHSQASLLELRRQLDDIFYQ